MRSALLPECQSGQAAGDTGWAVQADIVQILNHALSTEFELEQPWTDFQLAPVARDAHAPDGSPGGASADAAAGTLLQGVELPSDTDDSSFRSVRGPTRVLQTMLLLSLTTR